MRADIPADRPVTTGELNQWVEDLTRALADRDTYLREHSTVVQSVTTDGPCTASVVPLIEIERESQDRLYDLRARLREMLANRIDAGKRR